MFPDKSPYLVMPKKWQDEKRLKEQFGFFVEDGKSLDPTMREEFLHYDWDKFVKNAAPQIPHPLEEGRDMYSDLVAGMN